MNVQSAKPQLLDTDMAYTILSDLKRVTREYATAATESVGPETRQMFTNLMNDTLKLQGELYNAMQANNMYNASSPVLRQEIDKQIKQYSQTQQETNQFVQQTKAATSVQAEPYANIAPPPQSEAQQQPNYLM